ncbi:nitroreductase family protein [Patescibacteria group bacterium]|nr:nitroreductase family protein [Patescibacteria group bacterium]
MELQEKHDPSLIDTHEAMASKLNNFADNKEAEGLESWAQRQTYIALGFGLAACAELKIDSCPMEGFQKDEADKALKLPSYLKSTALLAIGYRQDDPTRPKLRYPESDLFSFR